MEVVITNKCIQRLQLLQKYCIHMYASCAGYVHSSNVSAQVLITHIDNTRRPPGLLSAQ